MTLKTNIAADICDLILDLQGQDAAAKQRLAEARQAQLEWLCDMKRADQDPRMANGKRR